MAREAFHHPDLNIGIAHAAFAERLDHRRGQLIHLGISHHKDLGSTDRLPDLVLRDAAVGAEDVTENARRNRGRRVLEIVIAPATDVGHPGECAPAGAVAGQRADLITQVVPDERKRSIGQSGSQGASGRNIGGHRIPVLVDALKDDLVFADVQPVAKTATDCLDPDFG